MLLPLPLIPSSGGPLEKGLRRVLEDARLGSLLIHNDEETQEPLLYNVSLPGCLKQKETARESWVMVLDSQVSEHSNFRPWEALELTREG